MAFLRPGRYLTLSAATKAQEIVSGVGLVCDTKEQIEALAKADHDGADVQAALQAVNGSKEPVCGVVNVAYIKGDKVGQVEVSKGLFDMVEILIVGVNVGAGFQAVAPQKQVTIFKVKMEGV